MQAVFVQFVVDCGESLVVCDFLHSAGDCADSLVMSSLYCDLQEYLHHVSPVHFTATNSSSAKQPSTAAPESPELECK